METLSTKTLVCTDWLGLGIKRSTRTKFRDSAQRRQTGCSSHKARIVCIFLPEYFGGNFGDCSGEFPPGVDHSWCNFTRVGHGGDESDLSKSNSDFRKILKVRDHEYGHGDLKEGQGHLKIYTSGVSL